jgi:6-pyruvoyltetrahydropterin/6-carboxytetrahydropterin synthase
MYEVTVVRSFSSAHRLREYDGNCENLHGHNWKVEVAFGGTELDRLGMLVDFRAAKSAVDEVLGRLDHRFLNDVPPFTEINPTTENLARAIAEQVQQALPDGAGAAVTRVRVWESEGCSASYTVG